MVIARLKNSEESKRANSSSAAAFEMNNKKFPLMNLFLKSHVCGSLPGNVTSRLPARALAQEIQRDRVANKFQEDYLSCNTSKGYITQGKSRSLVDIAASPSHSSKNLRWGRLTPLQNKGKFATLYQLPLPVVYRKPIFEPNWFNMGNELILNRNPKNKMQSLISPRKKDPPMFFGRKDESPDQYPNMFDVGPEQESTMKNSLYSEDSKIKESLNSSRTDLSDKRKYIEEVKDPGSQRNPSLSIEPIQVYNSSNFLVPTSCGVNVHLVFKPNLCANTSTRVPCEVKQSCSGSTLAEGQYQILKANYIINGEPPRAMNNATEGVKTLMLPANNIPFQKASRPYDSGSCQHLIQPENQAPKNCPEATSASPISCSNLVRLRAGSANLSSHEAQMPSESRLLAVKATNASVHATCKLRAPLLVKSTKILCQDFQQDFKQRIFNESEKLREMDIGASPLFNPKPNQRPLQAEDPQMGDIIRPLNGDNLTSTASRKLCLSSGCIETSNNNKTWLKDEKNLLQLRDRLLAHNEGILHKFSKEHQSGLSLFKSFINGQQQLTDLRMGKHDIASSVKWPTTYKTEIPLSFPFSSSYAPGANGLEEDFVSFIPNSSKLMKIQREAVSYVTQHYWLIGTILITLVFFILLIKALKTSRPYAPRPISKRKCPFPKSDKIVLDFDASESHHSKENSSFLTVLKNFSPDYQIKKWKSKNSPKEIAEEKEEEEEEEESDNDDEYLDDLPISVNSKTTMRADSADGMPKIPFAKEHVDFRRKGSDQESSYFEKEALLKNEKYLENEIGDSLKTQKIIDECIFFNTIDSKPTNQVGTKSDLGHSFPTSKNAESFEDQIESDTAKREKISDNSPEKPSETNHDTQKKQNTSSAKSTNCPSLKGKTSCSIFSKSNDNSSSSSTGKFKTPNNERKRSAGEKSIGQNKYSISKLKMESKNASMKDVKRNGSSVTPITQYFEPVSNVYRIPSCKEEEYYFEPDCKGQRSTKSSQGSHTYTIHGRRESFARTEPLGFLHRGDPALLEVNRDYYSFITESGSSMELQRDFSQEIGISSTTFMEGSVKSGSFATIPDQKGSPHRSSGFDNLSCNTFEGEQELAVWRLNSLNEISDNESLTTIFPEQSSGSPNGGLMHDSAVYKPITIFGENSYYICNVPQLEESPSFARGATMPKEAPLVPDQSFSRHAASEIASDSQKLADRVLRPYHSAPMTVTAKELPAQEAVKFADFADISPSNIMLPKEEKQDSLS